MKTSPLIYAFLGLILLAILAFLVVTALEHRYRPVGESGAFLDTWNGQIVWLPQK